MPCCGYPAVRRKAYIMNPYLKNYVKLTEFLGLVLGPDYEVVLHDVSDKNHSIVAIANGNISGRNVGGPMTSKALQIIKSKRFEKEDYTANYTALSSRGKGLRSSTFFIKDGKELVGLLCINFDDSHFKAVSDSIFNLCHPDEFIREHLDLPHYKDDEDFHKAESEEDLYDTIARTAEAAVQQELDKIGLPPERLTSKERFQIVRALDMGGTFYLKDSVKIVAKKLHCSISTVYRYLNRLHTAVDAD